MAGRVPRRVLRIGKLFGHHGHPDFESLTRLYAPGLSGESRNLGSTILGSGLRRNDGTWPAVPCFAKIGNITCHEGAFVRAS